MSDQPALLKAIAAEPLDDTPRLVYADWLDEHIGNQEEPGPGWPPVYDGEGRIAGSAHAELIRRQCSTQYPERDYDRERKLMQRLLPQEEGKLHGFNMELQDPDTHRLHGQMRGFFMPQVRIRMRDDEDNIEEQVRGLDTLPDAFPQCTVRIETKYGSTTRARETLQALNAHDNASRIGKLILACNMDADVIEALADCTKLGNLHILDLHGTSEINAAGVHALANCKNLGNLHTLHLYVADEEAVEALAGCNNLPSLHTLHLYINNNTPIEALANCGNLSKLRVMSLKVMNLYPHMIRTLAQCDNLSKLEVLDLRINRLNDELINELCSAIRGEKLPGLRAVYTGNLEWDNKIIYEIARRDVAREGAGSPLPPSTEHTDDWQNTIKRGSGWRDR